MTAIRMRHLTLLVAMQLIICVSSFSAVLRPPCRHCAPAAVPVGRLAVVRAADDGVADDAAAAPEPASTEEAATETEVVADDGPPAKEEEEEEEDDLLSTPAFLKQKLKVLEKELAEVEEQTAAAKSQATEVAEEWEQKRSRLQGDFDNFKARHLNQTLEAQLDAQIKVLTQFLPVLDNFDRARASISADGEAQETTNALYTEMHASLMTALGEMGMEKIEAVGTEFDYNLHMAIQQMPSDEYDEGIVCSELQPGYTCQGKLVRAAYVAVSA